MKKRWALAAVATSLVLSSCGLSLQSLPKLGGISGPTYSISATFANVVNLPDNAQVRVGAFTVGFVSKIGIQDFQAVVTMKIKKKTVLPEGTTAEVAFDTPLGEDFVQLFPPTGSSNNRLLSNGAHIPETQTVTAPSVEDAFGALGALLNGGGLNQLQTIIDQTNLALNGNQPKIRSLLNYLNTTITTFAQNTPAIDNSLKAIAQLSQVLNQGSGTISQGIQSIGPAVAVLASENKDFDALLAQLDRLSTAANSILAQSSAGTVHTVQALKPLLDQLVSVQQQLGPTLGALTGLEERTPSVVPGDYVQLAIDATVEVPPVPSGVSPLKKITVDPPEATESYTDQTGMAIMIEDGLP